MSRLLLLLALWFITLPIYSQDKNQSLKINEELIELRIQQQQLDKKIDDQKALLEEKFAVKQENLNYQKEEIGWRINTWINILGILVAFMGVVLPIIGFIYGKKVYADIKSQKAIIEEEHRKTVLWMEEKRNELEEIRTNAETSLKQIRANVDKSEELTERLKELSDSFDFDSKTTTNDESIKTGLSQQAKAIEQSEDATPFEREMAKALGFFYENKYEKCIEQHLMVLEKHKAQLTLDMLPDFYFRLAYSYGEINDHDNAIKYYELGLSIDNNNVVVWNNLGNSYSDKNDFDSAINKYSNAISINPNYAPSWYNRGIAYHNKENFEIAIEQYKMAIKLDSNYVRAYNNLGLVFENIGDLSSAKEYYSKALIIDPYNEDALLNFGNVYLKELDIQNAISYYQRAIDVNPSRALSWNNIGMAYNLNKEYEIAKEKLNQAKVLDPAYAETWYNLGLVFTNTNNYEKAIESYSEAIKLNPNYIRAIGNLAELLIIQDRNPEELLSKIKNHTSTKEKLFTYIFLDAIWQIKNKNNTKTKKELFESFVDALENNPKNLLKWSFFDLRKWISKETSSTGLDDESRKLIEELITMLEEWRDQDKNAESK